MKKLLLLMVVGAFLMAASLSWSGIPHLIHYQGMLTDDEGNPLNTPQNLTFRIYNVESGGTLLWGETHNSVPVNNGLFGVILGSGGNPVDLPFDEDYWLEIEVGVYDTLLPRMRLSSVPWAYRAEMADTAAYAIEVVSAASDSDWTISGDNIYSAVSGDVGIGTSTPAAKLDVRGTVNVGLDGTGYDVNFYGTRSGSRMFWDESKMAFRAGWDSTGNQWVSDSIGDYSFAAGYIPTASGEKSIAIGSNSNASRPYSTAIGNQSKATGNYATALGAYVTASGEASSALGLWSSASGAWSTAMGAFADARGCSSVALGYRVYADTNKCIVIGALPGSGAPIVNNIPYSLMVGFKGPNPTLFVDTANVGIGTTSPITKLDVNGDININSVYRIGGDAVLSTYKDSLNIFAGLGAGGNATKGQLNTFVGDSTGYYNQGTANTFLGTFAGHSNTTGEGNTFVGIAAGYENTTGNYNTYLGEVTGVDCDTCNGNTFVGSCAGESNEGSYNVFIGREAGVDGSNKLCIANGPNSSDILISGDFSTGDVAMPNLNSGTGTYVVIDGNGVLYKEIIRSSRRYKKNITEVDIDPEDILKLQTVRFEWKESGKEDVGLIAEDVEKAVPDLVIYDDQGRPNGVRYNKLALYLLETVKELKAENEELKKRIEVIESRE